MSKYFSIFSCLKAAIIFNDVSEPWQLGFQDSAAPGYTGLVTLHNTIGFYLVVISFSVFWVLFSLVYYYSSDKNPIAHKYLTHGTVLELVWTITPALIIIVVGHQWYWSYEYSDFITDNGDSIDFDSYMIPESDLELGQFRLLDVDNRLIIPVDCHIRLIVTGSDVLHSFAVPSLGLKLDAVPGRLNQVSFVAERSGTFYGQCSEICGVWHGFMPIVVEAVPSQEFLVWVDSASS